MIRGFVLIDIFVLGFVSNGLFIRGGVFEIFLVLDFILLVIVFEDLGIIGCIVGFWIRFM